MNDQEQLDAFNEKQERIKKAQSVYMGRPVIYVDTRKRVQFALICQVWNIDDDDKPNYVNLVYVSDDATKSDQYGRQIERGATSVPVFDGKNEAGRYFYFFDVYGVREDVVTTEI